MTQNLVTLIELPELRHLWFNDHEKSLLERQLYKWIHFLMQQHGARSK